MSTSFHLSDIEKVYEILNGKIASPGIFCSSSDILFVSGLEAETIYDSYYMIQINQQ